MSGPKLDRACWWTLAAWAVSLAALLVFPGCTRVEYVDRPSPVPAPTAEPTPAAVVCRSVPRSAGDCHRTTQDAYLDQYERAVDDALHNPAITWHGEITNGPEYLRFIVDSFRAQGFCSGIYQNEEVAVWSKEDQSFSENWDTILEAKAAPLRPRLGPGAHEWSCWPATTEAGS